MLAALLVVNQNDIVFLTDTRLACGNFSGTKASVRYRIHRTIEVRTITTAKGRTVYEGTADMSVELGEWVNGKFEVIAERLADGGHVSSSMIDAKKGAHTGALKRALAGLGIGKAAWEGKLDNAPDDDNLPSDDIALPRTSKPPPAAPVHSQQQPTGYVSMGKAVDTRPQQTPNRNRISSRQLAAVMAMSRKVGMEPSALRAKVKGQFGVQVEFVSREIASQIISSLQAQLNANGSGHQADPPVESLAS